MSKVLVAYFSHEGMNYLGGKIAELKKGNTRKVAEKIAARTGGDLFRIETVEKYPYEYRECVEQAKREAAEDARPRLAKCADVSGYDHIFLGIHLQQEYLSSQGLRTQQKNSFSLYPS